MTQRRWDGVPDDLRKRMRRIRSKDTKPELTLRSLLWAAGYRYRLHAKDLPGKPDLVFRKQRKVVFVHGCFWHQHDGCNRSHVPRSRLDYWKPKLDRNLSRDAAQQAAIAAMGWSAEVVWEYELKQAEAALDRVMEFLGSPSAIMTRSPKHGGTDRP